MLDRGSAHFIVFFGYDNSLQDVPKKRITWKSPDNDICTVNFKTTILDDAGLKLRQQKKNPMREKLFSQEVSKHTFYTLTINLRIR